MRNSRKSIIRIARRKSYTLRTTILASSIHLGDLKEQTLAEIWQSPRAKALFEMGQTQFRENSACTKCHIFEFCRKNHRRCLVKVIKAYGEKNWDYPDPRCQYAPSIQTNLIYK